MNPPKKISSLRLALIASCCALLPACESPSAPGMGSAGPLAVAPPVSSITRQPTIRVRIIKRAAQVRIDAPAGLLVGAQRDGARPQPASLIASRQPGRCITHASPGPDLAWDTAALWIGPAAGGTLRVNGVEYPGAIRLEPSAADADSFDVINDAPLEDYLPGVLQAELYQSWLPETFKAQAIAARSYALYEMSLAHARPYDVESTAASQAYAGAAVQPRAAQAVRDTRGVVLTSAGRVLPAFFSSCCGGRAQYALGAINHATDASPINTDRPVCTFCSKSAEYRWGPLALDRATLARRIQAWARDAGSPAAALADLAEIRITATTPAGRPRQFTLRDSRNHTFTLGPEEFRAACNYGQTTPFLHSSDVTPAVRGSKVLFTDGRGFGHGVGLCQFGAEGMAEQGYNAQSILAFYYPGATLGKIW